MTSFEPECQMRQEPMGLWKERLDVDMDVMFDVCCLSLVSFTNTAVRDTKSKMSYMAKVPMRGYRLGQGIYTCSTCPASL